MVQLWYPCIPMVRFGTLYTYGTTVVRLVVAEPSWDTSVAFSYAHVFHQPGTYYYAGGKSGNGHENMGQVNVVRKGRPRGARGALPRRCAAEHRHRQRRKGEGTARYCTALYCPVPRTALGCTLQYCTVLYCPESCHPAVQCFLPSRRRLLLFCRLYKYVGSLFHQNRPLVRGLLLSTPFLVTVLPSEATESTPSFSPPGNETMARH